MAYCDQLMDCGMVEGDMEECVNGCAAALEREPDRTNHVLECADEWLSAGECNEEIFAECARRWEPPPPPPPPPPVDLCEDACSTLADCGSVSETCVNDCSRAFEANPDQVEREIMCILEFMGDGQCDMGGAELCMREQL